MSGNSGKLSEKEIAAEIELSFFFKKKCHACSAGSMKRENYSEVFSG
ncbi:MAG: hypothetical protein K9K37_02425 [Desulfocapsa sp.]|nr:hypothetical protein [Desulfocapsa sp.]